MLEALVQRAGRSAGGRVSLGDGFVQLSRQLRTFTSDFFSSNGQHPSHAILARTHNTHTHTTHRTMAASALRRLLLCTLLLSSALARHVVELTPSNFDALVNAGDSDWLVEVYAPWCGHCKRMEPQYERAAEQLAGGRMRLGRIDGARWRSLTLRFGVGGFPSFFYVEGATGAVRSALLSAHTSEAIVKFAAKDQSGVKPIPVWTSPNGPVKRFLFAGMTYGEACAWGGGEASALECRWSGNEARRALEWE